MSSDQALSTNDLRARSVEDKRFQTQKHKWALGQAWPRGRPDSAPPRPMRVSQRSSAVMHRETGKSIAALQHQVKMARKFDFQSVKNAASDDSSADEDVEEASAAPAPDADITYSFDAHRGPGHGSQVLSLAVTQAVERFENKMTDKLVKEEYEVLGHEAEVEAGAGSAKMHKAAEGDEQEYEFV